MFFYHMVLCDWPRRVLKLLDFDFRLDIPSFEDLIHHLFRNRLFYRHNVKSHRVERQALGRVPHFV